MFDLRYGSLPTYEPVLEEVLVYFEVKKVCSLEVR